MEKNLIGDHPPPPQPPSMPSSSSSPAIKLNNDANSTVITSDGLSTNLITDVNKDSSLINRNYFERNAISVLIVSHLFAVALGLSFRPLANLAKSPVSPLTYLRSAGRLFRLYRASGLSGKINPLEAAGTIKAAIKNPALQEFARREQALDMARNFSPRPKKVAVPPPPRHIVESAQNNETLSSLVSAAASVVQNKGGIGNEIHRASQLLNSLRENRRKESEKSPKSTQAETSEIRTSDFLLSKLKQFESLAAAAREEAKKDGKIEEKT